MSYTFLEVGDLGAIVAFFIGLAAVVSFLISLFIAFIIKVVREHDDVTKVTRKEFWLTVLLVMVCCSIVTGMICGGLI